MNIPSNTFFTSFSSDTLHFCPKLCYFKLFGYYFKYSGKGYRYCDEEEYGILDSLVLQILKKVSSVQVNKSLTRCESYVELLVKCTDPIAYYRKLKQAMHNHFSSISIRNLGKLHVHSESIERLDISYCEENYVKNMIKTFYCSREQYKYSIHIFLNFEDNDLEVDINNKLILCDGTTVDEIFVNEVRDLFSRGAYYSNFNGFNIDIEAKTSIERANNMINMCTNNFRNYHITIVVSAKYFIV